MSTLDKNGKIVGESCMQLIDILVHANVSLHVCFNLVSSHICPTVNNSVVCCIDRLRFTLLFASNRRLQVLEQNTSSEATDETQELLESYTPQTLCWKVGTNSQQVVLHTPRNSFFLDHQQN